MFRMTILVVEFYVLGCKIRYIFGSKWTCPNKTFISFEIQLRIQQKIVYLSILTLTFQDLVLQCSNKSSVSFFSKRNQFVFPKNIYVAGSYDLHNIYKWSDWLTASFYSQQRNSWTSFSTILFYNKS